MEFEEILDREEKEGILVWLLFDLIAHLDILNVEKDTKRLDNRTANVVEKIKDFLIDYIKIEIAQF